MYICAIQMATNYDSKHNIYYNALTMYRLTYRLHNKCFTLELKNSKSVQAVIMKLIKEVDNNLIHVEYYDETTTK